jgi:glycosyltransferase involved in cell wall biosynthesis
VIDRAARWHEIEILKYYVYDVYIGIGSGNFLFFNKIKDNFNIGKVVILGTGPEPIISNTLVRKAHNECTIRNCHDFKVRRLINASDNDIMKRYNNIDAVFYYGNTFNRRGWGKVSENLFNIFPSTSPEVKFSLSDIHKKEQNRFLYFAANGLICKGLDLVIEAFDDLEGVILDICAPFDEKDFWDYYKPIVDRNSTINLHGFVRVGSKKFNFITSKTTFNLFPGSAEGCATSVVTVMGRGVIPVVTRETGLKEESVKYYIEDRSVASLRSTIIKLSNLHSKEVEMAIKSAYKNSKKYTNQSFTNSFENSFLELVKFKK